ncbi:RNA-directed DNA polymerase, eukaryota [Tanacetum coccineum]|uniref:RNA-directed DNA polymerase, eukaryota n=1 Tax=Tanacetum coccineum TaxID=301880 RepID=A0ABQ5FSM1_9ASTR
MSRSLAYYGDFPPVQNNPETKKDEIESFDKQSDDLKKRLVKNNEAKMVLLFNEGFHNTRIVYLGGLWVMIELNSSKSKLKFMEHVGVASWFQSLGNAQSDFAAKERIVWVDIEGVPLNAWSRSTFQKILDSPDVAFVRPTLVGKEEFVHLWSDYGILYGRLLKAMEFYCYMFDKNRSDHRPDFSLREMVRLLLQPPLDQGGVSDEILLSRMELTKQMQDIKSTVVRDQMQKAKIQSPSRSLLTDSDLKSDVLMKYAKAVWSCGKNKSPGPDGFTFEFFRKYWDSIGPDMCVAVEWFFRHNSFAKGHKKRGKPMVFKVDLPKLYDSGLASVLVMEFRNLKLQGIDFYLLVSVVVGLRLYALENNKECSVAVKMQGEIDSSFRRHVRGGVETQQLENIQDLVRSKVLSNVDDRWAWDLNGGGDFCVKDARDLVDEVLLPKENVATRWIKTIPIKVNVFAWKLHLDRLPTRSNLLKRGIQVQSSLCPICNVLQEDTSHLFFSCDVALAISRLICQGGTFSW